MGMSTRVVGFKPPDERWQRMLAVWEACKAAGVPVPEDVEDFFGHSEPDPAGVEVSGIELKRAEALREWSERGREGYEVDLAKLPSDIKILRFFNSW